MNKRQFLKGTVLAASGLPLAQCNIAQEVAAQTQPQASEVAPVVLRALRRSIEVNGKAASVFGLQQAQGAPGLEIAEGSAFKVDLRNDTDEATIIHWHGLTPPFASDGGGDIPLPMIAVGDSRSFDFPVGAAGTHWMHAHTLQEQALLAAPLIVTSRDGKQRDEQNVVVLLHDFSFTPATEILRRLQTSAPHGAMQMNNGKPMPGMAQRPSAMSVDLNDVEYDAYLANDRTLADPEIVAVEAGARIRIRIINGATATAFTMDFGEIEGTLIAVDGRNIEPVKGRSFPVSMGQRIDVLLELPRGAGSLPVLALREGGPERTGIILRPPGAAVTKLAIATHVNGPVLDLALEGRLHALAPLNPRKVDSKVDMALSGGMGGGYRWALEMPAPILVARGQRVEVTMRNTTSMAHPMHLHGHHFQIVAIDGKRFAGAVRDTVHIPPQRSVTVAVDADNPGDWPFHCHHLYHMAAGMMTRFVYSA